MQIFEQERLDGLENQISSSASFVYASMAEPCSIEKSNLNKDSIKSLASISDSDLYYVQSILVSSSWNKNDDIFDKTEVWNARNTPEDKPTNLEHDEATIIGHITGNWPITEDGVLINDTINYEELPEKYHILTGSVIYRAFTNPELKDRAEKLIAEIENGTKFVSMECFFKGFDYGLINKSTGDYKILPRNDSTAYLTKYLRAYGGLGEHQDYKIGRVLRNITFSGKGFVDKPANPDSIIFTKESTNKIFYSKTDDLLETGVSRSMSTHNEEITMNFEQEIAELKSKIEAISASSDAVKEAYTLASNLKDKTVELENLIKAKDETIAQLNDQISALATEKEEAAAKKMEEEEMAKKKAAKDEEDKMEEMKKAKSELDAALEVIAGYKAKEAEMEKKAKKMKRASALIERGFDGESADATVEQFDSLDDTAFDALTSLFAGKLPPWLDKNKKKDEDTEEEKKDTKKASVDSEVAALDTVQVEESVNLSVGGEAVDQTESTRAELIEFVCARLGKKLNKGE